MPKDHLYRPNKYVASPSCHSLHFVALLQRSWNLAPHIEDLISHLNC